MPDSKQKLVKVPDLGIVAFPSSMDDDKIIAAIRGHKGDKTHTSATNPHLSPIQTESSEHERQLKPSKSLSTSIPKIPEWANKPMLPYAVEASHAIDDFVSRGATKEMRDRNAKILENYDLTHPIQAGIAQGVQGFGSSMTTPLNAILMVAAPESKLLSAVFAVQAARGAYRDVSAARQAYEQGNNKEAAQHVTQAILGTGMAGVAGAHAMDSPLGRQVSGDVKALATGERGRAGEAGFVENPFAPKQPQLKPTTAYKAVDDTKPFFLKSENLIADKMKGPMPAEDVHKMLLSNGVKPEEMKWTGLDELLQGKGKQKVTPQEIQEHLAGNNLQVQEVVKGGGTRFTQKDQARLNELDSVPRRELTPSESDELDSLIARSISDYSENAKSGFRDPPKFSQYALPGAEPGSYRELLITAPNIGKEAPLKPEFTVMGTYQGEPIYSAKVAGGSAYLHHNAGFPWRVDLPNGESKGGFKTPEEAMEAVRNDPRYQMHKETQQFRSSHWDERNALGHVRFNDRTGPNGEKILHIEEIQSDWHQKGRNIGYKQELAPEQRKQLREKQDQLASEIAKVAGLQVERHSDGTWSGKIKDPERPNGRYLGYVLWGDTEAKAFKQATSYLLTGGIRKDVESLSPESKNIFSEYDKNNRTLDLASGWGVPNAPFKKTWPELLLKRMMKYAADHGYDGVSWTPGEDQNARYSLSTQVDEIAVPMVNADGSRSVRIDPIGGEGNSFKLMVSPDGTVDGYQSASQFTGKKLDEVIGKDMAKKIMDANEPTSFSGEGLEVGGSGMKGFYDKIIPDAANKLGKQWGAKVGETKINTGLPTAGENWHQGDMWTQLENDGRRGKMPLYAIFDRGGNWVGTTGDPSAVDDSGGEETAVKVTDEKGNLLKDAKLPSKQKTVPYLPITPQMRSGVKSIPYSLFTIPLAAGALSLSQIKAHGAALNPNNVRVKDKNGMVHFFKDEASAAAFRKAAGLE